MRLSKREDRNAPEGEAPRAGENALLLRPVPGRGPDSRGGLPRRHAVGRVAGGGATGKQASAKWELSCAAREDVPPPHLRMQDSPAGSKLFRVLPYETGTRRADARMRARVRSP